VGGLIGGLKRIEQLSVARRDTFLLPQVDGRIVICELVNAFRSVAFPNPHEMHGYIRFGIRPLLYNLLRRQFFNPRDLASCKNTVCRNFFSIERLGQEYCSEICSRQQRQRDYWKKKGDRLRKKKRAVRPRTKRK
jgi:hypothetical protein